MSIFDKLKKLFNTDSIDDALISISEEVINDGPKPPWKKHEIDLASDDPFDYSKYHKMILSHAGVKSVIVDDKIILNKDDRKIDENTKLKWLGIDDEPNDSTQKKI